MRVLVVGAGEVGFHLAERLSEESQDVVVIESDPDRADFASQQLDVQTVVGNGASLSTLEQASVRRASMLLAVTSRDEVNLIACLAAKRMGVEYTVARVSNPDYYERVVMATTWKRASRIAGSGPLFGPATRFRTVMTAAAPKRTEVKNLHSSSLK